jgi:hypothetical protein
MGTSWKFAVGKARSLPVRGVGSEAKYLCSDLFASPSQGEASRLTSRAEKNPVIAQ